MQSNYWISRIGRNIELETESRPIGVGGSVGSDETPTAWKGPVHARSDTAYGLLARIFYWCYSRLFSRKMIEFPKRFTVIPFFFGIQTKSNTDRYSSDIWYWFEWFEFRDRTKNYWRTSSEKLWSKGSVNKTIDTLFLYAKCSFSLKAMSTTMFAVIKIHASIGWS